jgi:uncharacterized phage infection (PIP) family protein YhgE
MTEVVNSIRRLSDIMAAISTASNEQAAGVSQVGEAVIQMDQVTQQNAALVEEMAASASSLKAQAQDLVQVVAVFQLNAHGVPLGSQRSPALRVPAQSPVTARRALPAPHCRVPRKTSALPVLPSWYENRL